MTCFLTYLSLIGIKINSMFLTDHHMSAISRSINQGCLTATASHLDTDLRVIKVHNWTIENHATLVY